MALEEAETEKKKGDLFSSIGALVGMVASGGNPLGAALGAVGGGILSGASLEDALEYGVSSSLQGATTGIPGLALNAFGNRGGSRSTAGGIANLVKSPQALQFAAMASGASPALQALTLGLGQQGKDGNQNVMNSLLQGIMEEELYKQRRPRFENLMSETELAQYNTGERRPDYKGTPVMAAMGGMIAGPGTGTSDSIPAAIYQDGGRVQEARLSDGEFVMTADAVKGAGGGNRAKGAAEMYKMMNQFERRA